MFTWLKSTFHFNAAHNHLRTGRFSEAAAGFSEVLRLFPDHVAAHVNRGVALQGIRDDHRALDDFDRALTLMSDRSPVIRSHIHCCRGISLKFIGDWDRAAADHQQALVLNPRSSGAHDELAALANLQQNFDAAIHHSSQAVKLAPRSASPYLTRGLAHFNRGSFAEAETDLRYAVNIANDPYALLFWFLASLKSGRNAVEELASRARQLDDERWPFPVIAFCLGKIDDGSLRTAAPSADDRAEAEFYIGEWHLHAGRRTEAIAALQIAAESCPRMFIEHPAAVIELKRQSDVGAAGNGE